MLFIFEFVYTAGQHDFSTLLTLFKILELVSFDTDQTFYHSDVNHLHPPRIEKFLFYSSNKKEI